MSKFDKIIKNHENLMEVKVKILKVILKNHTKEGLKNNFCAGEPTIHRNINPFRKNKSSTLSP